MLLLLLLLLLATVCVCLLRFNHSWVAFSIHTYYGCIQQTTEESAWVSFAFMLCLIMYEQYNRIELNEQLKCTYRTYGSCMKNIKRFACFLLKSISSAGTWVRVATFNSYSTKLFAAYQSIKWYKDSRCIQHHMCGSYVYA